MSGYSDTSRAAFAKVDITAAQRRVLDYFYTQAPGHAATRHDIRDAIKMNLETVCGRVHELLEAGRLESLPAENGRHPLRLKQSMPSATVLCKPQVVARMGSNGEKSSPEYATRKLLSESEGTPKRIAHVLPPTFNLSEESCKIILQDPKNAFYEQAKARLETRAKA